VLLWHLETVEKLLKFLPALWAVDGRIRHPVSYVVDMRRDVEPFFQVPPGPLVDALKD